MTTRTTELFRCALGELDGSVVVVRSNWDRIDVRGEDGALRFAIPRPRPSLLGEVLITADHLVVSQSDALGTVGFLAWDLESGELAFDVALAWWDFDPRVFPARGTQIVVAGPCARVWDLAARRERAPLPQVARADAIALDGARLAWVGDGGLVHVARRGEPLVLQARADVERLDFAGHLLVGSLADDSVCVWDVDAGRMVHDVAAAGTFCHVSRSRRHAACVLRRRGEPSRSTVVDLEAGVTVASWPSSAAYLDEERGDVVLADSTRTWRVRLDVRRSGYRR